MNLVLTKEDEEIKQKFFSLKNKNDIADILEISTETLNYYLFASKNYKQFSIPKKDGSERIIHAPISNIKIIQKKLLYILNLVFEPHNDAYGFIKNRSILDNAVNHTNKRFILNIDLLNYFPNINFGRVYGYYIKHFGFNKGVATILAKIVCIEDGVNSYLPQGAPTSPILSNMISMKLDNELSNFCQKHYAKYTRYADDITISSDESVFPFIIASRDHFGDVWLHSRISNIIERNGFLINYKKIRLRNYLQRQEVTGLIVNTKKPNVRRIYIRNLKSVLYKWEKYGYEYIQNEYFNTYCKSNASPYKPIPKIENYVNGKLNYLLMIRNVDDHIYLRLKKRFIVLLEKIPKK
jgi:hypothetical protein